MRGGKRKREDGEMCVFFLQGKCHRGSDCPYAHEILPPRKVELCKFYMKDCCAKKDKCLYMHSEFPCKYYHTGLKCYANKKCKFSHVALTDQLRDILAKHLDTAPKDILGEFARRDPRDQRERGDMRGDLRDMRGDSRDMRGDSRDMRGDPRDMRGDSRDMRGDLRDIRGEIRGDQRDIRGDPRDTRDFRSIPRDMRGDSRDMRDQRDMRGEFMRNKSERERKIPSLFDIKVTTPDEMRNSDGNHTPMPSPTQRSQDSTKSSDRDRDIASYSPDQDKERDREKDRDHERSKREKAERSKERKAKREKAREHRKERKERREKEKEKRRESAKEVEIEKTELLKQDDNKDPPELMSPTESDDNGRSISEVPLPADKITDEQDKRVFLFEENGVFPQHLPKKQRELFLRIQQQQREAESSQASANEDNDDDNKAAEENWYSSDEETTPSTSLPSILKNLTRSNCATTPTSTPAVMPLLNLLATASAAAKPLDVNKTPAPPTPFIPPNLDLVNLSTVFEALTNLQKMNSSSDQAIKQQVTSTMTTIKTEPEVELPKTVPSKPEPPRVRDPRLRSDGGSIENHRSSTEGLPPSDTDLRLKLSAKPPSTSSDVDLRSLPFKPVQHSAANEIDASISSHTPISWQLLPAKIIKADYASLQIQPKPGVNDPRLRRVVRPPTDDLGLPRDPRQRVADEPRARQPLLATPIMPPTPRYDEDHRPQFYHMDSDMRQFPPPTPRPEEEIYSPGPSRPVDPRQRNLGLEDPRRSQFPSRPDDIDLRPQMNHRVPFMNYNK